MKNAVNNEALALITGGDYGDSTYERDNMVHLYRTGDIVEVYTSAFHIFTERGTVMSVGRGRAHVSSWSNETIEAPIYEVLLDNGTTEWVPANSIQK